MVKEKEENILFEKILLRKVGMKMKALQWILKDWEKTEQIKVVGENTRNTPCKNTYFLTLVQINRFIRLRSDIECQHKTSSSNTQHRKQHKN